ncbi:MAG: CoA transferase [Chlorobi bacterium]|nr:CoA transferase [Chlorobiota bacterium]
MNKILNGIRVLDLTNVLSGPFATLHLAWLGAEVIKVENPKGGDLARKLGCVPEYNQKLLGTSFLAQNANKKSITLNLKEPKAKEIFRELVKNADILVENFRPGVMDRLELGYDALAEINPGLVYCAISGFGQTGPDAKKPAYDQIIQGLSGEMSINGDESLNPLRAGFPICDTIGGLNAAFAIMSALFHKQRSGEGQFIDVALLDSIMPMMGWVAANLMIGGQQPSLLGNENFTAAPSGTFKTADGYINIAANKHEQWVSVTEILDLEVLQEDPRFKERDTRKANRFELKPLIEEKLIENATDFWAKQFNAKGVPSGAILNLEDALNAPQIQHRNTFENVKLEGVGEIPLFNMTAKFNKTPGKTETAPPILSANTAEILGEIGYSKKELAELKNKGII